VVISPVDLRHTAPATAAARVSSPPRWLGELYAGIAGTLRAFPSASAAEDAPTTPHLRGALAAPKCRPYDAADCENACRGGDAASCAWAGVLYRDGRGVKPDTVKAWQLSTNACTHGDAVGCAALSSLVLADDGLRRDAARAAGLARAACTAGDGHGCAQLAQLCSDRLIYPNAPDECSQENVDRLRQRAVLKLKSACSGWAAYDCFTLATIYASGDPTTALRFAAGSCKSGDPGGCDELGALYEQQGDGSMARALFERACAAGYTRACERVALSDDRMMASRGASGG
jgi:TPR repeat protein